MDFLCRELVVAWWIGRVLQKRRRAMMSLELVTVRPAEIKFVCKCEKKKNCVFRSSKLIMEMFRSFVYGFGDLSM